MGTVYQLPFITDSPVTFTSKSITELTTDERNYYDLATTNGLYVGYTTGSDATRLYFGSTSNGGVVAGYPHGMWYMGTVLGVGYNHMRAYAWSNNNTFTEPAKNTSYIIVLEDIYSTEQEAYDAIMGIQHVFPITYRPTNCSFPNAPVEATVGDTVTVPVAFTEGYQLGNPSDIYVTCNGVSVPSTYANGVLTFTMPDPSQSG